MRIFVTDEDIQSAHPTTVNNPLTRALRRQTGQKWLVFRGLTAVQMEECHRKIALPLDVFERWIEYEATKIMLPFEFEFDLLLQT